MPLPPEEPQAEATNRKRSTTAKKNLAARAKPDDRLIPPSERWQWPLIGQPVDVDSLIIREWKHSGDSPIMSARPRKRRGTPLPPLAYLLKIGKDALGERLYSLAASRFQVPSAVVRWTTTTDMLEAAIRFEPAAWRPERIDPVQGTATTAEHSVRLRNPLDYYRHLALSDVLGEPDGAEFMVCEEVLFRIDAAAAGWFLFSFFVRQLLPSATEDGTAAPLDLSPQIRVTLEGLRRDAAPGYQVYVEMLSQIATWAEMPTYLAGDLRTCPAAEATYKEQPPLADAIEAYLRRQQLAIKTLLL